jgi:hypothetical protein
MREGGGDKGEAMEKQMVKINSCDETDCSYNKHNACHTLGITVGGPTDPCPSCDTFMQGSQKGGVMDVQGGVGACKVESCTYNQSLECSAPSIKIGVHESHPDCMTFKPR